MKAAGRRGRGSGFQFAGSPGSFRLFLRARWNNPALSRGSARWKPASYPTTATWLQFQLFRRYQQIEEATSAKRSETIVQVVLRFKRDGDFQVSVGPPLMIITPFVKDSINPDNRSPIFTEQPPDIRPFIDLLRFTEYFIDLSNISYPISSFRLTNTNDGYNNAQLIVSGHIRAMYA